VHRALFSFTGVDPSPSERLASLPHMQRVLVLLGISIVLVEGARIRPGG